MPRITHYDRTDQALRHFGVPADMHRKIMNALFAPNSKWASAQKKSARIENSWKTLLDDVRAALRGLTSNVHKQEGEMRVLYEQYIDLVRQARDEITYASILLLKDKTNPDGPKIPATLDDIRRIAAKRNAKLGIDGPTCTARWHTWVAPADRIALRRAFDLAYTRSLRGAGKRVMPFLTADIVQYNKTRMEVLRNFIADQRAAMTNWSPDDTRDPTDNRQPYSHIPHHALHLCALRMAERALDQWEASLRTDKYHGLDNPLPIAWTHLLDSPMRERIRAGDENPSSVSVIGLDSFYRDDGSARALVPETDAERAASKLSNGWD